MKNINDNEFIKLFRKMVYWEWYTDVNTTKLFLHCLLMASWKPGRWKGMPYERGQFFTSIDSLSKETGLTVREVRTALDHLKMSNEVTSKTTNKYTVITVVSFDKYQGERQAKRQTSDKRATNERQQNKNIKNIKNNKEYKEEGLTSSEEEEDDDDWDWDWSKVPDPTEEG